jgi:hypothetical protein
MLVARLGRGHDGRIGLLSGLLLALAIGTKPNATFAVLGILLGVVVAGGMASSVVRRWAIGAVASIAACAVVWLATIGIPHLPDVAADVRIWPAQRLPRSIGDLVYSVAHYPFSSDGAITGGGPVGLAGIAGAIGSIAGWRSLNPAARRLVGAAIGWLVAGGIPLLILNYHPNRYVAPLIPALSILLAAGASLVWRESPRTMSRRGAGAAALLALVLVAPGAVGYAGRFATTGRNLVDEQATFERIVPAGAVMEGDFAPLFAMTTGAQTIVSWPSAGVNNGDEYADRRVRWLLIAPGDPPAWVALHPEAWGARQRVLCLTWGTEPVCLYSLP